jgi:hypothetical protein
MIQAIAATAPASNGSRSNSADTRITIHQPGQAGGNADQPVVAAELRDGLFGENEDEPSVCEYRQPA